MKISQRGLDLIKEFEGFSGKAYFCPAGVPTIGYGCTKNVTRDDVQRGRTITRAQAEKLLRTDLQEYEAGVNAALTSATQEQFDACVSMAFNVGVAGFRGSSVAKAHNRGDFKAAARAFSLWNKSTIGGKKVELAGLTRRRSAEAALYLEGVETAPMPQAVEPERPMQDSQIVRGATVAGGTAALATVAEVVNTTSSIKSGVSSLNEWLVPLLLIAVIGLCGYIVYERFKQRSSGWS